MFLGCVGYLCCCLDEQYDDLDSDSRYAQHTARVDLIADEPRCPRSSSEPGCDEAVRRRYPLYASKRLAREVTEMGESYECAFVQ